MVYVSADFWNFISPSKVVARLPAGKTTIAMEFVFKIIHLCRRPADQGCSLPIAAVIVMEYVNLCMEFRGSVLNPFSLLVKLV